MNRLSVAKRVQVLTALAEGNSIAISCRMTGVAMEIVALIEARESGDGRFPGRRLAWYLGM